MRIIVEPCPDIRCMSEHLTFKVEYLNGAKDGVAKHSCDSSPDLHELNAEYTDGLVKRSNRGVDHVCGADTEVNNEPVAIRREESQ